MTGVDLQALARRLDLPTLRAALWTVRAVRRTRRQLSRYGPDAVDLPPVPSVAATAGRGVAAVLRRQRPTCLVSATVRQAWYAAHGWPRDLVIGVTSPSDGFRAHAWLEGDSPCHEEDFRELIRRPARV
jgi:hypothetical protein